MHDEDKEEAIELNESVEKALASRNTDDLAEATYALEELLFFVEGR